MSKRHKFKQFMKKKNLNPMNNRKKVGIILFATSIGLFFLFAFRTTYIVATGKVAGVSLKEKTASLYEGSQVVKAKRGSILDRYGNPIAEDATSYSLYVVLSKKYTGQNNEKLYAEKKDFDDIAEILAKYTKLDKKTALKYLSNGIHEDGSTQYQVEFGTGGQNITLETRQKIEADLKKKKISGVYFNEHPARLYPNGQFASHFIGYTKAANPDDDKEGLVGAMGLEQTYNDILSGTDGRVYFEKDIYGNALPGTVAEEKKAVDGQDIYTTLDSRLQNTLEDLMTQVNEKYEPVSMTAMLMEAKTGEIVAMSQRPTFNPETKQGLDDNGTWQNLLVESPYEPGSTIKLFTTAASMEQGQFNPNELFNRVGGIQVGDVTVNDHDYTRLNGKEYLNYRQAISWSSNIGMVKLEQKMGDEKWMEYLKKFGFGTSTHSGLSGESAGKLPGTNFVDRAMSAFGQAITVTNFQMMKGFSAIANDGSMLQPHYISKIVDKNTGKETITEPQIVGTPIKAQTAQQIRTYMIDTVEDPTYGIAYDIYKVPGYHVAAKTGTAQISDGKGYVDGASQVLSSVVEMVPADNPEYVLYITLRQAKTGSPSEAMAAIANPLMKLALDIKETDPETTKVASDKVTVADYKNMTPAEALANAKVNGVDPVIIGDGEKIKKQSTPSGQTLMPNQKLILITNGTNYMPDLTGWSKSDVTKFGDLLGLTVEFKGEGYVTKQSIAAETEITEKKLTVTLEGTE
ncbi:TPA: penicillin-binding protein [Enterococcus faecalis]